MPNIKHFQIGDRVRITKDVGGLARGAQGTVEYAYLIINICDVRFDHDGVRRIVHHRDLARVDESATDP